ncbi:relaxase/mobilization nuclease domain-containing protein [Faecalibacter rhinopitheci]|uniref:Relaxase/mobilization nuclease domain-containing protein n=1 Tax=Faecalibacter rhinopitheci TaxID=2779678 RepID=A0A8J7KE25_9FLAO|nr:relaxase/mobilization nuclease domain-containing protein [Faecalibacter rhinopitheci]MBF0598006.1 relaxase/mobilization nuclease domain-containing protein [Faecalibacter rhinopitheci]
MVKSVQGGGALFNYVCNPEKGYEVDRNLISGNNSKEIFDDFKLYIEQNQRASKKIFSMVLSPSINDGQKLNINDFKSLTKDFLNELDLDYKNQPYLSFLHTEKDHFHIHILFSRVKEDGSLLKDNHIGKKAQWGAHRVAEKRGLTSAKQVMIDKIKMIENEQNQINSVQKQILNAHKSITSRNINYEEYKLKMFEHGFKIKPFINKQEQLQGHRIIDLHTGIDYKASDIHRSLSLSNMMKSGILPDKNVLLHKTLEKPYEEGFKQILQSETQSKLYNLKR